MRGWEIQTAIAPPHAAWRFALAFAVAAMWAAGCGGVRCGPGTVERGGLCVPVNGPDAGGSDGGVVQDAGPADGGGPIDASGGGTDAAILCARRCDCPEGTTCTIEGVCEGRACTRSCDPERPCPCGQPCVEGFCDYFVGSLLACTMDCDCPAREECAAGRCVRGCGVGTRCVASTCAPCGRACEPYSRNCVEPGTCTCTQTCFATGFDGMVCQDGRCVAPADEVIEPPGGPFVETTFEMSWTGSATSSAPGAATTVTVVLDSDVSTDDLLDGTLRAPDGREHHLGFVWSCRGGPGGAPWVATVDLTGQSVPRAGTWEVEARYIPMTTGVTPSVARAWIYLDDGA